MTPEQRKRLTDLLKEITEELPAYCEAGKKYDNDKLKLDLIPPEAIRALGEVLTHGAAKYGPNQWQGVEARRYEAALLRHWLAWKEGQAYDPESGLSHLWHVLCNAAFLVTLDKKTGGGCD